MHFALATKSITRISKRVGGTVDIENASGFRANSLAIDLFCCQISGAKRIIFEKEGTLKRSKYIKNINDTNV